MADKLIIGAKVRNIIEDDEGVEEGNREDQCDFGDAQNHDISLGQIERITQITAENKGKSMEPDDACISLIIG